MDEADRLFDERITLLALARTLAPAATIRRSQAVTGVEATIAAPDVSGPLPHISIDLQRDERGEPLAVRSPDLAIVATIGEGGMGRVHLARQRSLDRDVAVKTLKEGATPAARNGLLREARLTGSLEHPGVIPVHALGVDEHGGPLLVMKRVEGVDWATLLAHDEHPLWSTFAGNPDRLAANLEILTQVCKTVEFAHSRGILHRDLKPENVMVGSYGEVYLVDWGIATTKAAPATEGICGTPAYMAPEMFSGAPVDERTDVYLLGATLHEVLTRRARHQGTDIMQVLKSAMASKPFAYDPSVPEHLAALCNRATAREREARPQTARAFRDELAEFLRQRSALALSDAASERLTRLQALLDGAKDGGPPSDLAGAYRLATEARFGFTESRRAHANSREAKAGLRASVLALIDLELRQQHADTAEALLREIDDPDPSLAARIAAVRERDETRRRETERLAEIDRAQDTSVSATSRTLLIIAFALAIVVATVLTLGGSSSAPSPLSVLLLGAGFLAATVIMTVAFRKRLLANAYGGKLSGMMLVTSTIIVVARVVGFIGGSSADRMFTTDLWITVGCVAIGAVTVQPRLWWSVAPLAIGAVLTPFVPALAGMVFAVSLILAFAIIAIALQTATKKLS